MTGRGRPAAKRPTRHASSTWPRCPTSCATTRSTACARSLVVSVGESGRPRRHTCRCRISAWRSSTSSRRAGRMEAAAWERRRAASGSGWYGARRPEAAQSAGGFEGGAWAEGEGPGCGSPGVDGEAPARGRLPGGVAGLGERLGAPGPAGASSARDPEAWGAAGGPGSAARAWPSPRARSRGDPSGDGGEADRHRASI